MAEHRRKLIEVALPLEAINTESAREKSIRHGHPATLHLWWARRPLAACRAMLFAQLVDDPSSHPDEFPTEDAQRRERDRLFGIIEELVRWENISDTRVLDAAKAEIRKSCDGNPPPVLDPFAGGGSIPLEAQRLGLEAHASDLNPVAVLINKALIEIPPRWNGHPPVCPDVQEETLSASWTGAQGLAEDVRRYGTWMRDRALERIGHLYPDATLPDGTTARVIAWIWARTIRCPNPACGAQMPLMRSFWLSKKKDRKTWLEPMDAARSSNGELRIAFEVVTGKSGPEVDGTVGRNGATCLACQSPVPLKYIRAEGQAGRMSAQLVCVVAEGGRRRVYVEPTDEHIKVADVAMPDDVPDEALSTHPQYMGAPRYGLTTTSSLFTNRQLVALATFSDLVQDAHAKVAQDAEAAGLASADVTAYADAVATYLTISTSRITDRNASITTWDASPSKEQVRGVFARQAIPMAWDFAEGNPFGKSSGNIAESVAWVTRALDRTATSAPGIVSQENAGERDYPTGWVVSTDPPYYDNVPYSDLSDFFYVWLRRSLGSIHRDSTSTMLTPKSEELVANAERQGSKEEARKHFELGFNQTFRAIRDSQDGTFPMTLIYAFKQSESDLGGSASTGWETMLSGLIESGFAITATWPLRSELSNRMRNINSNALASSIVLACRPREVEAATVMRSGFVAALQGELPTALRDLQQGAIAPVDLPQAAVGPGMAIFSRYERVLESDGSPMRVRTALQLINRVLDEVLSEQEGDFDPDTRWCVRWLEQHGFEAGPYGEAETMATARNVSVRGLEQAGVLRQGGGNVSLLSFDDLAATYDPAWDDRPTVWEGTLHAAARLRSAGTEEAARFLQQASTRLDLEAVKELGYVLFAICERKKWTDPAVAFNGLVTSWLDLQDTMRTLPTETQSELEFDIEGE